MPCLSSAPPLKLFVPNPRVQRDCNPAPEYSRSQLLWPEMFLIS
jgi:hypothetical protein